MSKINKTFKRTLTAAAIGTILGLTTVSVNAASNTDGTIAGVVKNSSDQALAGVTIKIVNLATGVSKTLTSDGNGSFQLARLSVGKYNITANKNGYEAFESKSVQVTVGEKTNLSFVLADEGQTVTIIGAGITSVDTTSSEVAMVMTEDDIDRIPVGRSATAIALLAPGTTKGDSAFGGASFGGSSVGENVTYINGMNLTSFRNGLAGTVVPFEFYSQFNVKTGGYSAEYGRSTGGVVTGVSKSGGNEFKASASVQYVPDSFDEDTPDVFLPDGTIYNRNSEDTYDSLDVNLQASGAIIQDQLFFYALYNPRNIQSDGWFSSDQRKFENTDDDAFWGVKLDWFISEDHKLELTSFSDDKTSSQLQTILADGSEIGTTNTHRGGQNNILRYTGYITDDLTVSAMRGETEYNSTSQSPLDGNPLIIDVRSGSSVFLGNWVNSLVGSDKDTREATRLDFEYFAGDDHDIRFGFDRELNTAENLSMYSGGIYWRYLNDPDSATGESVRIRNFQGGGKFETEQTAIYVEDTWEVTDQLTLRLGLRNESFDNRNASNESFIKIDNQLAPRLGAAYDVNDDGTMKLFANYGRYYLPIAANTNIRMSGAELFTEDYYQLDGVNADDSPNYDPANLLEANVYGDGTVADTRSVLDTAIEPMYQDEFILGFEKQLSDDWSLSVRGIHRDLKVTIEDVAIDAAVIKWAAAEGLPTTLDGSAVEDVWGGFHQYVLTNPGNDMSVYLPEYDRVANLTADMLGYPKAERTYKAIDMVLDRQWDGVWSLNASYTWSKSEGNSEGYVRSDNGQDDAGLTTLFDQPGLLDGAYGYLPNDRRNTVKVRGAYQITDSLRLSMNYLLQTGKPINAFGVHPTDVFAAAYGSESFYQGGVLVPRGSKGRTPTITSFNFGLTYETDVAGHEVTLKTDIFNLFNSTNATSLVEQAEEDTGAVNPAYLLPRSFQTPRYVRFYASMSF